MSFFLHNFTLDQIEFYFYNKSYNDCYLGHCGFSFGSNYIVFEKENKPTKRTFETSFDVDYFLKRYNFLE